MGNTGRKLGGKEGRNGEEEEGRIPYSSGT